jgi:DNA-binding Xre family transcriptional regulator
MTIRSELVATLKRLLRTQSITYAELARRLKISEAAVKRMFSLQALSLSRLEQICDVLDIGIEDIAEEVRSQREPLSQLSVEQEQALLREPKLMLALYLALNRWSEDEVVVSYQISRAQWTRLLVRLDRMGVLSVLPGNRVRLRTARNFRWRSDGPIERFFQRKLLPEYFSQPFTGPRDSLRLLTGMLSSIAVQQLERRVAEFTKEFDALLDHDASLPVAQRVGVSVVFAMRPWQIPLFESLRRPALAAVHAKS